VHHELQSVTDAEDGNPQLQNGLVGMGRVLVVNRARSTREDDTYGRIATNFLQAGVERKDNGKDVLFADAARNQLRILRPEVEDDDRLGIHG
jgi:hypothetical protein